MSGENRHQPNAETGTGTGIEGETETAVPVRPSNRRQFMKEEAAVLWQVFKMKPIPEV